MTSPNPRPHPKKPTNPWCSVIIPTLNEADQLAATLHRLRETAPTASYEVIVADGGSHDGTPALARRCGARVVHATRGRARQMNAGAEASTGRFLYFLHADTWVPDDWCRQLAAHGDLPACFRLRFAGQDRLPWLRLYAWFTRFDVDAFRFGDQSLWVSREDFRAVGGFPDWPLLEDNGMVRRLRDHRGAFRILAGSVTTSPRKYLRNGFVYTQLVYVLLYTLHRVGVSHRCLQRVYSSLLP